MLIPAWKPQRLHPAFFTPNGKKLPILDDLASTTTRLGNLTSRARIFVVGSIARGTFRIEAEAQALHEIGRKQHYLREDLTSRETALLKKFMHDAYLLRDGKITEKCARPSDLDIMLIADSTTQGRIAHHTILYPLLESLENVAGMHVSLFAGVWPSRGRCFDVTKNTWKYSVYPNHPSAIQPPPF